MATLVSAYNPDYSRNSAILTGNDNRVTVEVEDSIDEDFWRDLLDSEDTGKEFHFKTYRTITKKESYTESKGKSSIMFMASSFDRYHIGCVDADNDWLLSDTTEFGKILISNKYLLHSYGYSIENLMCCPETLADLVWKSCIEKTDFDFVTYVDNLSHAIYPLLIWSLYLYSIDSPDFTAKSWHKILSQDCSDTDRIAEIADTTIKELQVKHPDAEQGIKLLEQQLESKKSLNQQNAYLFVRGHALFAHIFRSILKPITEELFSKHINDLSQEEKASYSKYVNNNRLEELLSKNYNYKHKSQIYNHISEDVQKIWA